MAKHRYYIFNKERLLLCKGRDTYHIYEGDGSQLPVNSTTLHTLNNADVVCHIGCTTEEQLPDTYEWMPLRESYKWLSPPLYQQAGKASELLYFDHSHQYCGRCGGAMQWSTDISKRCTACGDEIWPQLNTAIIVLVHKGDEALLVKAKSFKRDFYGLVAGFVETGESLEECVCREVHEETGLEITNLRYFGSQPWPYPMGLMVGFHADYKSGEIGLLDGELKEAAFFSRHALPTIPEKLSMARMLIDDWVKGGERTEPIK